MTKYKWRKPQPKRCARALCQELGSPTMPDGTCEICVITEEMGWCDHGREPEDCTKCE